MCPSSTQQRSAPSPGSSSTRYRRPGHSGMGRRSAPHRGPPFHGSGQPNSPFPLARGGLSESPFPLAKGGLSESPFLLAEGRLGWGCAIAKTTPLTHQHIRANIPSSQPTRNLTTEDSPPTTRLTPRVTLVSINRRIRSHIQPESVASVTRNADRPATKYEEIEQKKRNVTLLKQANLSHTAGSPLPTPDATPLGSPSPVHPAPTYSPFPLEGGRACPELAEGLGWG